MGSEALRCDRAAITTMTLEDRQDSAFSFSHLALGELGNTAHRSLLSKRLGASGSPAPFGCSYFELTAIRFTFDSACGSFGMVTVSTPFLNAADTFS
jgi:hypothetical protein